VPCVPFANELVVTLTGVTAAATVNVSDFVAVCAVGVVESVTLTLKVKEPEAVGVPEMTPAEDSVRPPGRDPELTVQL
jgi:hypothetical protein